jgi:hypothetical protein
MDETVEYSNVVQIKGIGSYLQFICLLHYMHKDQFEIQKVHWAKYTISLANFGRARPNCGKRKRVGNCGNIYILSNISTNRSWDINRGRKGFKHPIHTEYDMGRLQAGLHLSFPRLIPDCNEDTRFVSSLTELIWETTSMRGFQNLG